MNWDAIGAVGEILGALGVIVTLVYLSAQIRQSTRSSQANRLSQCREARTGELPPEDHKRVLAWVNAMANTCLSIAFAHQNGEMNDDLYEAYYQDVHRFVETYPGTLPQWNQVCDYYPVLKDYKIFSPVLSHG